MDVFDIIDKKTKYADLKKLSEKEQQSFRSFIKEKRKDISMPQELLFNSDDMELLVKLQLMEGYLKTYDNLTNNDFIFLLDKEQMRDWARIVKVYGDAFVSDIKDKGHRYIFANIQTKEINNHEAE